MKSSGSSHIFHVIVSTLMLIASSGVVAAGSNDHVETPTQKQKVVQILEALETVDLGPLQYIDPNHYTNHNARVPDGLAGYKVKLMVVPKGAIKVHLVRVFEDGDFVFTHGEFNFSGHPKAIFDIFRFENEKVVEHWDNVQDEVAASGTSTPTMLDGPAMASDLKATKKNKALITRYLTDVIAGRHDT
jgi:predicted SnoaL-like aldol condensation-catalyzing enzyme